MVNVASGATDAYLLFFRVAKFLQQRINLAISALHLISPPHGCLSGTENLWMPGQRQQRRSHRLLACRQDGFPRPLSSTTHQGVWLSW